ncbi:hypothetical protein [Nostoc sp. PCC 9305]|uniref:hypothetical protein n=1 Tax=Nostoc sp. PCC 9305 TaxID=296636 RepID=UPI0039C65A76
MRLTKIILPMILASTLVYPAVAQTSKPVSCNFDIEDPSKIKNDTTFHDLKLRIKTRKGILEVEQINEGPITTEQEAQELRTELIEIASIIDII